MAEHGEPDAGCERTLDHFRQALTVRNRSYYLTPEQRAWPRNKSPEARREAIEKERAREVPKRIPTIGIPVGRLMAARWCTLLDAIEQIGRAAYAPRWDEKVLSEKPYFPYPHEPGPFVFRKVALAMDGIAEIDPDELVSKHCGAGRSGGCHEGEARDPCTKKLLDAGQNQIVHDPHCQRLQPEAWLATCIVRDPSWDIALGAYEILYEALAEGLIRTEAERVVPGPVPRQFVDGQPRGVNARERVKIDSAEWRRDDIVMAQGLVTAWWTLGPDQEHDPPWLVLVDRGSLGEFLERYAEHLVAYAKEHEVAAAGRSGGRPREVELHLVESDVLPRWRRGDFGTVYRRVEAEIQRSHGVGASTAKRYRMELGICRGGKYAQPDLIEGEEVETSG